MFSTLKTLSLVIVAALTLSTIAAGSASGARYHSEVETVFTHSHTTTFHIFHSNVGTVSCETTTATGKGLFTFSGFADWVRNTYRKLFSLNKCTGFGFPTEVKTNGCEYELLEPNASLAASTRIVCPTGKQIEIVAVGFCTMTVAAQSPTGSVTFSNEGSGSTRTVKAVFAVTGITYGGNCGSGTNGTTTATITIKAYKDESLTQQVGFWVS